MHSDSDGARRFGGSEAGRGGSGEASRRAAPVSGQRFSAQRFAARLLGVPSLAGLRALGFRVLAAVAIPAVVPCAQAQTVVRALANERQATVVVFNERDPLSTELALFYAEQRGVPRNQVVGVRCGKEEVIGRDEFDAAIAAPLRRAFVEQGWWKLAPDGEPRIVQSRIRFLALMRGIPLRIAGVAEPYPGDATEVPGPLQGRNDAAVDSELAALGLFSTQITGALNNPYYRSFQPIMEFAGAPLLAVCRLDGPSEAAVRRMILDSVLAERYGLLGRAYIDSRSISEGGYKDGDVWLGKAADLLRIRGVQVVDNPSPGVFPEAFPMDAAALYFGWYTRHVTGPFKDKNFFFARGAVAAHIHSFSATTLRDEDLDWTGPLVARGACASFGNVAEPYLQFTTEIDLFVDRLTSGMTFAESAYAATRAVSWMNTFVGDPLYRPYARWNNSAEPLPETADSREWLAYRDGALVWYTQGAEAGVANLAAAGRRFDSGLIFEGLGLLQLHDGDHEAAGRSFREARRRYSDMRDVVRTICVEADAHVRGGRRQEAIRLVKYALDRAPRVPAVEALKQLLAELKPKRAASSEG